MSEPKFTPGPWEVEDGYVQRAGRRDVGICEILNMDGGGESDWFKGPITEANARLIASSPRMYDFIKKLSGQGDVDATALIDSI